MKKSKTIKPITFKDLDLNAILSKVEEACIEIKKITHTLSNIKRITWI